MEALFWMSAWLILYAYCLYPSILAGLTWQHSRRPWIQDEAFEPSVSLIIPAYNEEKCIKEKIENSLALNYPQQKLEIIIVSDGSTDRTNDIVQAFHAFPQIRFYAYSKRQGKAHATNVAMKLARGDICVFSDANVMYDKDAIRMLTRNFADPTVGCVTGHVDLINQGETATGEGLYMRYERFIHERESFFATAVGTDGAMYALRRELFRPLAPKVILDDLATALRAVESGLRIVYENEAFGYEIGADSVEQEFKRKVRIVAGGYQLLQMDRWLLNPLSRPRFFFLFVSHKLLRWLLPWIWAVFWAANLYLFSAQLLYKVSFLLQTLFLLLASAAWHIPRLRKHLLFRLPLYVTSVNLAAAVGLTRYFRQSQSAAWDKARR